MSPSASRSPGLASTIRAKRNRLSSSESSLPSASARATWAVTDACSSASGKSRGLDQRLPVPASATARVGSRSRSPNSDRSSRALASCGTAGSVSARRSEWAPSRARAREKSSSPRLAASAPSESWPSAASTTAARAPVELPCMSARPARGCRRALLLEGGDEPLDRAGLAVVVLEGLTDDAAGGGGGHAGHLVAEGRDRLGALGLQLGATVAEDPVGLLLRLLAHVGDDRGALLACVLPDLRSLVLGVGELVLVVLLGLARVGLGQLQVGELL